MVREGLKSWYLCYLSDDDGFDAAHVFPSCMRKRGAWQEEHASVAENGLDVKPFASTAHDAHEDAAVGIVTAG